jgi:hypothetical protein
MPKIPSFKEDVAINQTGIGPITDVGAAGAEGRAIAALGQEIVQAGASYAKYKEHKEKADYSIGVQAMKNRAIQRAQDSLAALPQNPNLKEDGQNFVELFDGSFSDMQNEIGTIQNGKQRALYKNIVDTVRLQYRTEAYNTEITMGAGSEVRRLTDNEKAMSSITVNDPTAGLATFEEHKTLIMKSTLDTAGKQKLLAAAESSYQAASVQHFVAKEDFEGAREYIRIDLVGKLTGDEIKEITHMVNAEEEHFDKRRQGALDRQKKEAKEEKEILQDQNFRQTMEGLQSDKPLLRESSFKNLQSLAQRGQISQAQLTAGTNIYKGEFAESSAEVLAQFTQKINDSLGKPQLRKGLEEQIWQAEADKLLHPKDRTRLLHDLRSLKAPKKAGTGGDAKGYAASKKLADDYEKRTFPKSAAEVYAGLPSIAEKRLRDTTAVRSLQYELMTKKGMKPHEAYIEAVRQRFPNKLILLDPSLTSKSRTPEENLKNLDKVDNNLRKLKEKAAKGTREDKIKYLDQLKQSHNQRDAAENAQGIQDILNKKGKK